ncbi:hypothetical protein [Sporisorium scitamineum]|uniref:Uncharacterized protein n=1 Tax=Sporisorium scitamineum TaxID=49012 RepID=A0A0F7S8R5_9BASI|nr:hypothetical protein [Sporisorium scitamineum]
MQEEEWLLWETGNNNTLHFLIRNRKTAGAVASGQVRAQESGADPARWLLTFGPDPDNNTSTLRLTLRVDKSSPDPGEIINVQGDGAGELGNVDQHQAPLLISGSTMVIEVSDGEDKAVIVTDESSGLSIPNASSVVYISDDDVDAILADDRDNTQDDGEEGDMQTCILDLVNRMQPVGEDDEPDAAVDVIDLSFLSSGSGSGSDMSITFAGMRDNRQT